MPTVHREESNLCGRVPNLTDCPDIHMCPGVCKPELTQTHGLVRLGQEDCHGFIVRLCCIARSCLQKSLEHIHVLLPSSPSFLLPSPLQLLFFFYHDLLDITIGHFTLL